jgi:hypothetical protein
MIYQLTQQTNPEQIREMLAFYSDMIKIVVDIRRGLLAGGGEMQEDRA